MPNIIAPKGFVPSKTRTGGDWKGLVRTYYIPSSNATATFVGDVVVFNGAAGAAGFSLNGIDMEGVPEVVVATSGTVTTGIAGVVVGFLPDQDNLMRKHRFASTYRAVMVCPVENVVFAVQEDADTTPVAAASIGLNAAFTLTAGNATTGVSAFALDSSTVNTTATLPLRILGLTKRVGNAFNTGGSLVDPAVFDVMFTGAHQMAAIPAGI